MIKSNIKIAQEFFRPVTFLTRLTRWSEIFDRRTNRPIIIVERVGNQLMRSINFGFNKSPHPRTHVALYTIHPRMPAALISGELRIHRLMTDLAAKLRRLSIMIGLVTPEGAEQKKNYPTDAE